MSGGREFVTHKTKRASTPHRCDHVLPWSLLVAQLRRHAVDKDNDPGGAPARMSTAHESTKRDARARRRVQSVGNLGGGEIER